MAAPRRDVPLVQGSRPKSFHEKEKRKKEPESQEVMRSRPHAFTDSKAQHCPERRSAIGKDAPPLTATRPLPPECVRPTEGGT